MSHKAYCFLRTLFDATVVRVLRILSIAIQDTARQRVTEHDTLLTEEVNLITITAIRTKRIDAVSIATRNYRTTSTPLYELTTLTANLNDVRLAIAVTKINKQERVRHQRFTRERVQLTEQLHVIEHSTTLERKLNTVSHLVGCELTTKNEILTRTSYKVRINHIERSNLLLQNTIELSNRLC